MRIPPLLSALGTSRLPFAATILLGAFLVFQVQPILGRHLVPRFGGGAGVWMACLTFFQVMLLGGYCYAHLLSTMLAPRLQAIVHIVLLAASLLFLPLMPSVASVGGDGASAAGSVLWLLLATVGLPYLLLASTGPLLQSWFARAWTGRSPYRLYALSNVGSLLALLTYPFAIEPALGLRAQGYVWTAAYVLFVVACAVCARRIGATRAVEVTVDAEASDQPEPAAVEHTAAGRSALWLALAATGSVMLLATTNQMCQELAAMPLLWVAPLAIYLLTFVIAFDHDRWYDRRVFLTLLGVAVAAVAVLDTPGWTGRWAVVGLHAFALFTACMVCHGELAASRPSARHLTRFYLCVALGGALGGVFVTFGATALFLDYWEYPLALVASCALGVVCLYRAERERLASRALRWQLGAGYSLALVLAVVLTVKEVTRINGFRDSERNFYGTLHVVKARDEYGRPMLRMLHGRTEHGIQLVGKEERRWATTYYGPDSGFGLAFRALSERRRTDGATMRLGVVGLGVGTMATVAGDGDTVRFYEINPAVERVARRRFSFLQDSLADVEVVLGDARLVLERELARGEAQRFDLLAIDAFNSHAVPMHLLTREAFAVYTAHLHPDHGVLALHVSNPFVDLVPVVRGAAEGAGLHVDVVDSPGDEGRIGTYPSIWVIASRDPSVLEQRYFRLAADEPRTDAPAKLWTDDYATLLPHLTADYRVGRWWNAPNRGRFVIDGARVLSRAQQERALLDLQQLYVDTGGSCPLMLVTLGGVPESHGPPGAESFRAFRQQLLSQLGMEQPEHALMLTIAADDRLVSLDFGPAWDEPARQKARGLLGPTALKGLQSGNPGHGVIDALTALQQLARERLARTAASPR